MRDLLVVAEVETFHKLLEEISGFGILQDDIGDIAAGTIFLLVWGSSYLNQFNDVFVLQHRHGLNFNHDQLLHFLI